MKSFPFLTVTLIAASLAVGGVGCKKTPKSITTIPGSAIRVPGPGEGGGVPVTPIRTPATPGGGTVPGGPGTQQGTPVDGGGVARGTELPKIDEQGIGQSGERPEGVENRQALQAETVYFDFDRAEVKTTERTKVEAVATYLKNNPKANLKVEGNCDERGTEEYNRSLGERRALGVREYLVTLGIDPARVTTISYGEDRPAVPGNDEAAYSKNRRADFVVLDPSTTGIQ